MKGSLGLALVLGVSVTVAACGSSTPQPEPPSTPTAPEAPTAEPTTAPTGAEPTTAPSGAPTAGPDKPKGPSGAPSQAFQASTMIEEAKKIGVDLSKSPDLAKLPLDKKKKIMPLMQKALGMAACTGCHVEGDMKAKTRNREIAAGCWKNFVAPLRDEKGGAVFCDSCHAGKSKILNRSDMDALKKFMEVEYEGKLAKADKGEVGCTTCHGEAVEVKIFDKLWKVPAK